MTDEKKPSRPDEPWIRDLTAANVICTARTPADFAAICEGETMHCERCGKEFPLWPPSEVAQHMLDVHSEDLTISGEEFSRAVVNGNPEALQHIGVTAVMTRPSIRRRGRDLGFIKVVEFPGPPRIALN